MYSLHSFTNILIPRLLYCDTEREGYYSFFIFRLKANLHDSCKIGEKYRVKLNFGIKFSLWQFSDDSIQSRFI